MNISEIITYANCRNPENLTSMDSLYRPLKTISMGISSIRAELNDAISFWADSFNIPIDITKLISNRHDATFSEEEKEEMRAAIRRIDRLIEGSKKADVDSVAMRMLGTILHQDINEGVTIINDKQQAALIRAALKNNPYAKARLDNSLLEKENHTRLFSLMRIKQDHRQNNERTKAKLQAERRTLTRALNQRSENDHIKLIMELMTLFSLESFLTKSGCEDRYRAVIDSYFENVDEWLYANTAIIKPHEFRLPKMKTPTTAAEERAKQLLIKDFMKKEVAYIRESLVGIFVRIARTLLAQINNTAPLNGNIYLRSHNDQNWVDRMLELNTLLVAVYGDARIMCYNFDRGVASWE